MTIGTWFGTRRIRHGATAGVVVLATGGLFLIHANAAPPPCTMPVAHGPAWTVQAEPDQAPPRLFASPPSPPPQLALPLPPAGPDTVHFSGPHVQGSFAVSDARALARSGQPFYADVTLTAEGGQAAHAPLAMVVVLDTSGSMGGEKLAEAKSAVKELVRNMRDDDDVAFVRYASSAELVQPLARVGDVRRELEARIDGLRANGGTMIPAGLELGIGELERGGQSLESRVRRVVLVSDGLDGSRPVSERLARTSSGKGVTVSSMGIGLDFDEAYMGGLARAGHGNFGFVNDGPTLTAFLKHELVETATTVAQNATVHLHLPDGVRFVKATGADAEVHGRDVDLRVGAIFADDPKRVLVQMATDLPPGAIADFTGSATWKGVDGAGAEATIPQLEVSAVADAAEVERARNETVFARVVSVEASERQVEAAQAYANGDAARAHRLIQQNISSLGSAGRLAPAPLARALASQAASYDSTWQSFASSAPSAPEGKVAAKRAAASNMANSAKAAF